MNASELRGWCDARRGRLSDLARALDVHRQFVWQWAEGKRPIPAETLPLVIHEIKRAERMEGEAKAKTTDAAA